MTTLAPALVPGLDAVPGWLLLAGLVLSVPVVHRSLTVVQPYEEYVFVDDGSVSHTLETGINFTSPFRSSGQRIDLRTQTFSFPVTSINLDDVAPDAELDVDAKLAGEIRVSDPERVALECPNYHYEMMERLDELVDSMLERRTCDELLADERATVRSVERTLEPWLDDRGIDLEEVRIERTQADERSPAETESP